MTSFVSTSKAVRQLFSGGRQLIRCLRNNPKVENYVQSRCFRSLASVELLTPYYQPIGGSHEVLVPFYSQNTLFSNIVQKRGFFGCGDGDEGSKDLSKVHEEKCVMGYSPEQMYAVVAAVDMYQDFLPWCKRSDIVRRHPDGSFDAELEIGFKFLVESYVSRVKLVKPKMIKTTSSQSSLFNHLINIWEFHPGPVPGTCNLHFLVDFKFQSPFYSQSSNDDDIELEQPVLPEYPDSRPKNFLPLPYNIHLYPIASTFFKEVSSKLVGSFRDRCRLIYGPGVPVTEQRA